MGWTLKFRFDRLEVANERRSWVGWRPLTGCDGGSASQLLANPADDGAHEVHAGEALARARRSTRRHTSSSPAICASSARSPEPCDLAQSLMSSRGQCRPDAAVRVSSLKRASGLRPTPCGGSGPIGNILRSWSLVKMAPPGTRKAVLQPAQGEEQDFALDEGDCVPIRCSSSPSG
jgi:hypothetical protein